jgi:outer membrane protein, multidrug efflux system
MALRSFTAALLAATALGGCATMAPRYERPALPVAQSWPTPAESAATGPVGADAAWRDVIRDTRLQGVVALALQQNRDLRVAVADIERARAAYGVQRAELLPAIDAGAAAERTRTPASLSQTGRADTTSQYRVTAGFSAYELDLFGRVRSLSEAGLQTYLATEEDRRAVQISLIAEVANAWLTLAADQELLAITSDSLVARDAALDLAQKRFAAGTASELDVRQAQTLSEQARSDAAVARARVA